VIPYLKHLHVFRAVCEDGSMKKAGARLARAQSAVSRSVQELEDALGAPLFERNARGILLTEVGRLLLRRVDFAFTEMAAARAALAEIGSSSGERLLNAPIFSLAVGARRLEVLIAFAARRHMGAVAALLEISQPAVSMALRDFERSTGLTLFHRSAAGMRSTPAGEVLLVHVRRALAELRIAEAEIAAMQGSIEGRVTVGALPFARAYVLPAAMARLLRKHPRLTIGTVEGPFETLAAGLRCGDIDFLLGALQPVGQSSDLVREDLFGDRIAVIARADHALAGRGAVTAADLSAASWVLPRQGTPTRKVLAAAFGALGLPRPKVVAESSDLSIIRGLLLESDIVTAASLHLFHHELEAGSLVALPVELPEASRSVGVLRRPHDHISPGARLLIEEIRALRDRPAGAALALPHGSRGARR
jgi:LysR family transcriptional regulator of gallate degradation